MRSFSALAMLVWLAACEETQTQPQQTVVRLNDDLRKQEVVLDVAVILRGMDQARERRAATARSARERDD